MRHVILIGIIVVAIIVVIYLYTNQGKRQVEGFGRVRSRSGMVDKIRDEIQKEPTAPKDKEESETVTSSSSKSDTVSSGRTTTREGTNSRSKAREEIPNNKEVSRPYPVQSPPRHAATFDDTLPIISIPTLFDLFTAREDTMKMYGVTPEEMDRLVDEYRKEHEYEHPRPPSTLTFNMRKWQDAQDIAQDSMYNLAVRRNPYADGLVDELRKNGNMRV